MSMVLIEKGGVPANCVGCTKREQPHLVGLGAQQQLLGSDAPAGGCDRHRLQADPREVRLMQHLEQCTELLHLRVLWV